MMARHSAYLWVDDSDALAQEWLAVGVEVHMPEDTDWDQHERAKAAPERQRSPVWIANRLTRETPFAKGASPGAGTDSTGAVRSSTIGKSGEEQFAVTHQ